MTLRLNGSTSGYTEIDAPAVAANNTLTLPTTTSGSLVALDSSGRLGIGTTAADQLLHLKAANPVLEVEGTAASSGDTGIHFKANANEWFVRADNSTGTNTFSIKSGSPTSSTHRFLINSSGQCGIGTSSPGTRLTLSQSISTTFGNAGTYFGVGDVENGSGSYRLIGFGYKASSGNEYPAVIGYTETDNGGNTKGALVFGTRDVTTNTAPTERMRITSSGFFKATSSGAYISTSGPYHEFTSAAGNEYAVQVKHTGTSGQQYGIGITTTNDQNDATRAFLECLGGGVLRAQIRSNGGLANYSANNANLSDINTKKDITPAADTWNCLKEWEIVNYRYKDQPDDADLNLGVIAQQVAESCPEVITIFQEAQEATDDAPAREERLGVKEQQMYWMAIKALQEAQVRIETLESNNASLEARLTALEVTP